MRLKQQFSVRKQTSNMVIICREMERNQSILPELVKLDLVKLTFSWKLALLVFQMCDCNHTYTCHHRLYCLPGSPYVLLCQSRSPSRWNILRYCLISESSCREKKAARKVHYSQVSIYSRLVLIVRPDKRYQVKSSKNCFPVPTHN